MTIRLRAGRYMLDLRHEGQRYRIAVPENMQSRRGAEAFERQVLADLARGLDPRNQEAPTVQTITEFRDEFLRASEGRGNKPRYLDAQRQILRDHLIPALGDLPLDKITEAEIDRFRDDQIAKGLSRKTVRNHLEVLRRVLRVAHRRKMIGSVPIVDLPKKPARKINFLSFDEADAFLAAAPDAWRSVFLFAMRTGLRLGEVRGLRWSHLDLDEATVYVQEQRDDAGTVSSLKSDQCRTVNLAWDVVDMLRARPRTDDLVFPGVTDRGAWWFTTSTARRAKLGRHFTFHDLRHTFASHAAMRGVDVETLRQWLGHASLTTTQIYLHVSGIHRRAAADLLAPPRTGLRVVRGGGRGHTMGTRPERRKKTAR